jgi:superfamily II DNA or RNA helicase
MSLRDLKLKYNYRSNIDNFADDFFNPILAQTVVYRRATGYFSSSVFNEIGSSLEEIAIRNGHIRIICSPHISDMDEKAIRLGYQLRGKDIFSEIICDNLCDELNNITCDKHVLDDVCRLIALGILDIKLAMTDDYGLYHEKIGVFTDSNNNMISFSGSVNETEAGLKKNLESFEVFCSWTSDETFCRVKNHKEYFDRLWNDNEKGMIVFEIPKLKHEFIKKFRQKSNLSDERWLRELISQRSNKKKSDECSKVWMVPEYIKYREYQLEAVKKWEENNFNGIFEMATGTGKTLTALLAIVELYNSLDRSEGLFVVIVCPYQHLVEQWCEDLKNFGINPVVGHSDSKQKKWKTNLKNSILAISNTNNRNCFITTNASLCSKDVHKYLCALTNNEQNLIVIDEAHNVGASGIRIKLEELAVAFKYRLALSATLDRHNDIDGTKFLRDYFGKTCISYGMDEAIKQKMLTEYYYYPCVVSLTADERQQYEELSLEISKCLIKEKNGKTKLNKYGKILCLNRARIIACAKNKLNELRSIIDKNNLQNENDILVYCGVGSSYSDDDNNICDNQINSVTKIMGNEFDMKVTTFTAVNTMDERHKIIADLESKKLQAIVAIKCLDEGVNIPCVKTAVIMASTTNPKEYVQRRGRVLRLFPGKEHAVIFDMITLPYGIDEIDFLHKEDRRSFLGLIKNELIRCNEFSRLARNHCEGHKLLLKLAEDFNLQEKDLNNFVNTEE